MLGLGLGLARVSLSSMHIYSKSLYAMLTNVHFLPLNTNQFSLYAHNYPVLRRGILEHTVQGSRGHRKFRHATMVGAQEISSGGSVPALCCETALSRSVGFWPFARCDA